MDAEGWVVLLVGALIAFPGVILGAVLCSGHGSGLIAGYNTAPPEEREAFDEKALCRSVGVLVLLLLGCSELMLVGSALDSAALIWAAGIAMAVITVGGIVWINVSKRLKKKKPNDSPPPDQ